ncbi:hypothetical protein P1X15_29610 [Runella sp. MFBS21]|uniref:hypothetical protein n=1 Tax=Runella sp. MFBS21 TaxID=3034018 RepID=UPI0023F85429|nr:hypothetical protein [Runella sp. MFBS21]MDF7821811.1 hypothetical protein [Runella sp. MFBS21]
MAYASHPYQVTRGRTIRTIDRWYKVVGLHKSRSHNQRESIGKSTAVHNIWQRGRRAVDAKESLTLVDGQKASYLTITGERSGADFARFFPMDVFVKYLLRDYDKN